MKKTFQRLTLSVALAFALSISGCSFVSNVTFDMQYDIAVLTQCSNFELLKDYVESGKIGVNDKIFYPWIMESVSPLYLVQRERPQTRFLRYMLDAGADPNVAYKTKTLLMCTNGADKSIHNPEFGKMLIEYGADVNLVDDKGFSALDYAAQDGYYQSMAYIMDANPIITSNTIKVAKEQSAKSGDRYIKARAICGAALAQGLDFGDNKMFALAVLGKTDELLEEIEAQAGVYDKVIPFYAAAYCEPKALEYFANKGFDLSQLDDDNEDAHSLLWIAASTGNIEIANYLIKNGASLMFDGYDPLYSEVDPLNIAVRNNRIEMVKFLLHKRADFNITQFGFDGFIGDEKVGRQIVSSDSLQHAVYNNNFDMVHLLEDAGYPMDEYTYYRAIKIAVIYDRLDMLEYLLENGANPNYTDNRFNDNRSVLDICGSYGSLDALKLLHKYGAKIKTKYSNALYNAVEVGNYDVAKYLLDNGMDVNSYEVYEDGSHNFVPLFATASHGYLDMIQLLLEYGADVNNKEAAVLVYSMGDSERITKYLLKQGAYVNLQSTGTGMRTALHVAAKNHRLENARLLLDAGADTSLVNSEGKTALDVAHDWGADEVAALIEEYNNKNKGATS